MESSSPPGLTIEHLTCSVMIIKTIAVNRWRGLHNWNLTSEKECKLRTAYSTNVKFTWKKRNNQLKRKDNMKMKYEFRKVSIENELS